jgi:hypothetical protein
LIEGKNYFLIGYTFAGFIGIEVDTGPVSRGDFFLEKRWLIIVYCFTFNLNNRGYFNKLVPGSFDVGYKGSWLKVDFLNDFYWVKRV